MYRGGIIRKTPEQIESMAAAGTVQARCLKMLRSKCRPGVTTAELDRTAGRFISSQGAEPTFLGYRGFPGTICASSETGPTGTVSAASATHPSLVTPTSSEIRSPRRST